MLDDAGRKSTIPCVQSDLPDPSAYARYIEEAHSLNWYSNFGSLCEQLSADLLDHFGLDGEACVPCSSATSGLSAALIASSCEGPVLIPAFTFAATYGAVRAANLQPLVMDVCESNWAIAPHALASALDRTGARAAILVSPFGLRVDFREHMEICFSRGVIVIIDSAAGLGVQRINRCNSPSVFEVFSLHATKPMGIGEGGAIYCAEAMANPIRRALNFGLPLPDCAHIPAPSWGFNGKLSELHAAVGLAQMRRYRPMIAGRQRFAAMYQSFLLDYPVMCPQDPIHSSPWQVFPVLSATERSREALSAKLVEYGIEVRRYYRPSISQWPEAKLASECPVSERLSACMLALPVRSVASEAAAEPIITRVQQAFACAFNGTAYA